jgi:O-succinylbenzoic acid--CoA ligase
LSKLHINHKEIPFKEIQNQIPETTFEKNIFNFCVDWLTGKEYFEIYTSGSTGKPKLIKIYRQQMQLSAQMTGEFLKLKKGDKALVCLNTEYIAGKMMLVRGLEIGMNLHIIEPSTNPFLNLPITTQIDFIALVPMQLQGILKSEPTRLPILQKMRAIIVGGAAVGQELERDLQLIKAPIYSTYGMTETITHIALKRLNGTKKNQYYKTLPKVSIKQDSRGCLVISSPTTLDKELITNDLVRIIDESHFEYLGRIDNVINSGGVKIQAEKVERVVENALLKLKCEYSFVIIPLKDEVLGQSVNLVVESKSLSVEFQDSLFEILKANLGKYEVPKKVFYLPQFPRTLTEKVDKQKMNKLLLSRL